ncbi:TPA: hypothetical protein ACGQLC_004860 [Escherichia coli]
MPIFYSKCRKIFPVITLRKIFILLLLFLLFGIDKEEYFEEEGSPWVPRVFIKHDISPRIIFEVPVSPYYILYNAELAHEKYEELQAYCEVRYGVKLPECKVILLKRMSDNGFYKPE